MYIDQEKKEMFKYTEKSLLGNIKNKLRRTI